jgi:hypothetical protein
MYRISFKVYYSKETLRIQKEVYFLEYRDLPFFPWRTIPGSEFESYDEVSEWTKKNLGVKTYYNSKGTEEAC